MEGNCKGTIFRGNVEYVTRRFGKMGLVELMEHMKQNGHRLDLENLVDGQWYPLEVRMQFLRSTVELFSLKENEIFDLGKSGFKQSTIIQLYLKIAGTPKKICEYGPKIWSHNYDVGRLEAEYNGPEGTYFRIYEFEGDPLLCNYLRGFYMAAFEKVGCNDVGVVENKCICNGDDVHEFKMSWS